MSLRGCRSTVRELFLSWRIRLERTAPRCRPPCCLLRRGDRHLNVSGAWARRGRPTAGRSAAVRQRKRSYGAIDEDSSDVFNQPVTTTSIPRMSAPFTDVDGAPILRRPLVPSAPSSASYAAAPSSASYAAAASAEAGAAATAGLAAGSVSPATPPPRRRLLLLQLLGFAAFADSDLSVRMRRSLIAGQPPSMSSDRKRAGE